tara:strand:- start:564 stop:1685 length:1122 start_codon:yes stop_codon:yes gene_type:complete
MNPKIGITGQNGFIGWHLSNSIKYIHSNSFDIIPFEKSYFKDKIKLSTFIKKCNIIVHLAGVNRMESDQEVYEENKSLNIVFEEAIKIAKFKGHLIFASSIQEKGKSLYGKSKKETRILLEKCITNQGGIFTGIIIPNVFGPFSKPNYNSFIATFCSKIMRNEKPTIYDDDKVPLIFVGNLVNRILNFILAREIGIKEILPDKILNVSYVLKLLKSFKSFYIKNNKIPLIDSDFKLQLFNTFRSFIDIEKRYPVFLNKNTDNRGFFSEIIRCESGGQFSYSTTLPGITRGNHFHTRKVERFTIIQGDAQIQLRKINSNKVFNLKLNGEAPSYVDIPIWFTHNITNIGKGPLITLFWINEPYNEKDADTYFEKV